MQLNLQRRRAPAEMLRPCARFLGSRSAPLEGSFSQVLCPARPQRLPAELTAAPSLQSFCKWVRSVMEAFTSLHKAEKRRAQGAERFLLAKASGSVAPLHPVPGITV